MFPFKRAKSVQAPRSLRPYLNLGCGSHFHTDWTNVDIVPVDERVLRHDLRRSLPFSEASFQAVYHSHVLEHVPKHEAPSFLLECFRVLRPGGIIRVVVPDLEMIARHYLENLEGALRGEDEAARRHEWMTIEMLDQMVRDQSGGEMLRYWRQQPMPAERFVYSRMGAEVRRWVETWRAAGEQSAPPLARREVTPAELGRFRQSGEVHRWMYDRYSLQTLLHYVGFESARVCAADESSIPDFASFHLDVEPDGSVRKPDSLFMEARKPADAR